MLEFQQKKLNLLGNEFKLLAKNASMLAGTRVFEFLTGLIRVKISAILLGTFGMGIVDQFTFITNKISEFTTKGTVDAFVKQIASNNKNDKIGVILNSAIKSYSLVIFGFVILASTIILFFKEDFTKYLFGDIAFMKYFYLAIITFPLLVLRSIPFSILKAFKNIKKISKSRIYIVLVQLTVAIPMIYFFKLKGALLYVPFSYIIDLLFLNYFVRKYYFIKYKISIISVIKAPLITSYLKELFLFSAFGLSVGVYAIISAVICRSIVVSKLGVEAIGIYSPVILLASLFTGFILPSLSTYLFPRFSELTDDSKISNITNEAIRLSTLILIPLLFLAIPFSDLFIGVFFSEDFIESSNYLPYHIFGMIFFVWRFIFAQSLTPTGKIKIHGIFRVLQFSFDIGVTYFAVKHYGLYGWMLKYILSSLVFFIVYALYSKNRMDFRLEVKNLTLMIFLLSCSIIIIVFKSVLSWNFIAMFLGVALLFLTYFFLSKDELNYVKKLKNKII